MTLVAIPGEGWWFPRWAVGGVGNELMGTIDTAVLDAAEEEVQLIGRMRKASGGASTFGLSSKLDWLVGPTITFGAGATLRVGLKTAASVDETVGPPARATLGASAFAVYDDLVGGTDTLTALSWRSETMSAGMPVSIAPDDLVALCFHLGIVSGSHNVKVRLVEPTSQRNWPTITLVTSGPTYTSLVAVSSVMVTFDDGTLGWLGPTAPLTSADATTATIGTGNIVANVFQLPFPCKIDALATMVSHSTGSADFALELWSDPLGATPLLVASLTQDANLMATTGIRRMLERDLPSPVTLIPNTVYAMGVKQLAASAVSVGQRSVASATFFQPLGLDATCYAANSTGGATFVQQVSGTRRYHIWARVSHLDDGMPVGGGSVRRGILTGGRL